jgi:hypothetical protein
MAAVLPANRAEGWAPIVGRAVLENAIEENRGTPLAPCSAMDFGSRHPIDDAK